MTSTEIEVLVANKWGVRRNVIVPNVHWGMGLHECDLLILSKSNWATEIEIKISKGDLKKDSTKTHGHQNKKIKYLYFAIPEKLEKHIDLIPVRAGIIIVRKYETGYGNYIDIIREPQRNQTAVKLGDDEVTQLMRLGCMRIFSLKSRIVGLLNDLKYHRNRNLNGNSSS